MGARKNLNVTTSPVQLTATGAADVTGFRVFASDGATPKSNYTPWSDASTKSLDAGDKLEIDDQDIYLFLGVTGSAVDGQLANASLIAMLDAHYDGTEKVKFCLANKSVTANVPELDVSDVGTDWEDAVAF